MHTTTEVSGASVSRMIPLASIQSDAATQARVKVNATTVRGYAKDMALQARDGGLRFPAIIVFAAGSVYWLGDGFHRVLAAREAGLTEILADVRAGTQRDALLHSILSNTAHGLPRTNADKRNAVRLLLADPEWSQWSDREISRRCTVSNRFVTKLRKRASVYGTQIAGRKVRRGDTVYEMQTKPAASTGSAAAGLAKPAAIERVARCTAPATDPLGLPLAESTGPAFAVLDDFRAAKDLCAQLAGTLHRIAQRPGGEVYRQCVNRKAESGQESFACADLGACYQKLLAAEPYCAYCPYCHLAHPGFGHPDCKTCRGRGWTTRAEFEACPEGYRQEILRMRSRDQDHRRTATG